MGATIALGLLLTAQHALAAAPVENGDGPALCLGQTSAGDDSSTSISRVISRTDLADVRRIDVTDDNLSATTVLGIELDTRLSLFEHYGVGRATSGALHCPLRIGPWTDGNDSYTITIIADYGDGEDR